MTPLWTARYGGVIDAYVETSVGALRKLMQIGSVPAEAREAQDGVAVWVGETQAIVCDPQTPPPALGQGDLRIIWDPVTTFLGAFFSSGESCALVRSYSPGKKGTSAAESARHAVNCLRQRAAIEVELTRSLSDGRDLHGGILNEELARLGQEAVRCADALYGDLATPDHSGADRGGLLTSLQGAGLASVLGYDAEVVNALAAVGIANTVTHERGGVELLLKMMKVGDAARDRLFADYQHVQGLRILSISESQVIALV